MDRHQSSPDRSRRRRTATTTTVVTPVRVGQKDAYDPSNPTDDAEYRTVLRYRDR
jgi:hypothetical protein